MEKPTGLIKKIIDNLTIINNFEGEYSRIDKDLILNNLRNAYMLYLNITIDENTENSSLQLDNYQNNSQFEEEKENFQLQISNFEKQIADFENQISSLENDKAQLIENHNELIADIEKSNAEKQQLQSAIETLRQQLNDFDAYKTETKISMENYQNKVETQKAVIESLETVVAHQKNEMNIVTDKNTENKELIADLYQEIDNLQAQLAAVKTKNDNLEKEIPTLNNLKTSDDSAVIEKPKENDFTEVVQPASDVDESAVEQEYSFAPQEAPELNVEEEQIVENEEPEAENFTVSEEFITPFEEEIPAENVDVPLSDENFLENQEEKIEESDIPDSVNVENFDSDDVLEFVSQSNPVPNVSPKSQNLLFDDEEVIAPKSESRSLNDLLGEKKENSSLGDKFQTSRIADLTKAMSINDKFLFIRELFKNRGEEFSKALNNLNECKTPEEAFLLMEEMKKIYFWDTTSQAYLTLCDLIRRKFL